MGIEDNVETDYLEFTYSESDNYFEPAEAESSSGVRLKGKKKI